MLTLPSSVLTSLIPSCSRVCDIACNLTACKARLKSNMQTSTSASSDLLHMHLALAAMHFQLYYIMLPQQRCSCDFLSCRQKRSIRVRVKASRRGDVANNIVRALRWKLQLSRRWPLLRPPQHVPAVFLGESSHHRTKSCQGTHDTRGNICLSRLWRVLLHITFGDIRCQQCRHGMSGFVVTRCQDLYYLGGIYAFQNFEGYCFMYTQ